MALKKPINKYVISSPELLKNIISSKIKIIDCRWYLNEPKRGEIEYKNSHLFGSIFFDIEKISDDLVNLPHMFPTSEKFLDFVQKNSININDEIIIYDQEGYFCSTRVWFTFKLFGFKKVKILDGGIKDWCNRNLPLTNVIEKKTKSEFQLNSFDSGKIITKKELENLVAIKKKNTTIIDARPEKRFLGAQKEPRPKLKKGNIKHSINIPFKSIVKNNSYIKTLDELKDLMFFQNKINKDNNIICYCGSGVTACNIIFALTLLGCKKVKLYDGSWAEWGKIK